MRPSIRSPLVPGFRLRRLRVPKFLPTCQTFKSCSWEALSSSLVRRCYRWRTSSLFRGAGLRRGSEDETSRNHAPLCAHFQLHLALRHRMRPRLSHVAPGQMTLPLSPQNPSQSCLPQTQMTMTLPQLSSMPTLLPSCSRRTPRAPVTKARMSRNSRVRPTPPPLTRRTTAMHRRLGVVL
jgi:hypothetical protein